MEGIVAENRIVIQETGTGAAALRGVNASALLLSGLPLAAVLLLNAVGTEGLFNQALQQGAAQKTEALTKGLFFYGSAYVLAMLNYYCFLPRQGQWIPGHWSIKLLFIYAMLSALWSYSAFYALKSCAHLAGAMYVAENLGILYAHQRRLLVGVLSVTTAMVLIGSLIGIMLVPELSSMMVMGKNRWQGVTTQPNNLGIIAMLGLLVSGWLLLASAERYRFKAMASALFLLSAFLLLGSNSMTCIVASLLALATLVVCVTVMSDGSRTWRVIRLFGVTWAFILVGLVVFMQFPDLGNADQVFKLMERSRSFTGRTDIWLAAWEAIKLHPVLGTGFDGLNNLLPEKVQGQVPYAHFHNGYLEVLLRGGVVGLSLVGVFLGVLMKRIAAFSRLEPSMGVLLIMLYVAFMVHNITETSLMRPPSTLWVLVLSAFSITVHAPRARRALEGRPASSGA